MPMLQYIQYIETDQDRLDMDENWSKGWIGWKISSGRMPVYWSRLLPELEARAATIPRHRIRICSDLVRDMAREFHE
jgi:hypothetical protein